MMLGPNGRTPAGRSRLSALKRTWRNKRGRIAFDIVSLELTNKFNHACSSLSGRDQNRHVP
jgi:hypothetical protein